MGNTISRCAEYVSHKFEQNLSELKQYAKSEGGKFVKDAKIIGNILCNRPHFNGAKAAVEEYKKNGNIGDALRQGYRGAKNTVKQNFNSLTDMELPLSPAMYAIKKAYYEK